MSPSCRPAATIPAVASQESLQGRRRGAFGNQREKAKVARADGLTLPFAYWELRRLRRSKAAKVCARLLKDASEGQRAFESSPGALGRGLSW